MNLYKRITGRKLRRYLKKSIKKYGVPKNIYVDKPTPLSTAESTRPQRTVRHLLARLRAGSGPYYIAR